MADSNQGGLAPGPHRADDTRVNNDYLWEHWKYPETVGNDTGVDDINFNSNSTSEYAKNRMANTSPMTHEPFMLFEFMRVDNDNYGEKTSQFVSSALMRFGMEPTKMAEKMLYKLLKLGLHVDKIWPAMPEHG